MTNDLPSAGGGVFEANALQPKAARAPSGKLAPWRGRKVRAPLGQDLPVFRVPTSLESSKPSRPSGPSGSRSSPKRFAHGRPQGPNKVSSCLGRGSARRRRRRGLPADAWFRPVNASACIMHAPAGSARPEGPRVPVEKLSSWGS